MRKIVSRHEFLDRVLDSAGRFFSVQDAFLSKKGEDDMNRSGGSLILVALMIGLLLPAAAYAQATGSVKGVVRDTTGAVLPGANVTLTSKATGAVNQQLTNETGAYSFVAVNPGQ